MPVIAAENDGRPTEADGGIPARGRTRSRSCQIRLCIAVALHSAGPADVALAVLKQNLTRHPDDRGSLLAVVSPSREKGDFATALESAKQLAARHLMIAVSPTSLRPSSASTRGPTRDELRAWGVETKVTQVSCPLPG